MLHYVIGDIVSARADIIVNAANGIGWMGGFLTRKWKFFGIAESINYVTDGNVEKEIHRNYKIYLPGNVFFTNGYGVGRIGIIHAVTMLVPGWWTTEKTVVKLLPKVIQMSKEKGARTIAIPFLGCGTGRLKKKKVQKIYETFFRELREDIDVYVYDLKE